MTNRSAIIVAFRCFLIYALLQTCHSVMYGVLNHHYDYSWNMGLLLLPLVSILIFSELIVDFLTPRSNEILADTNFSLSDLQSVAFSAVGLFILYGATIDTIILLGAVEASRELYGTVSGITGSLLAKPIFGWVFGLYLVFGGRTLRMFLTHLRNLHPRV